MIKILTVCLGNICRSPMAHGVLEHKIKEKGLDMEVDSAGTASYHIGEQPDSRAIAKSKEYDIDISHYRGRQFEREDFERFDFILTMDQSNYENVIFLAQSDEQRQKVKMMLNYLYPNENRSVPDPYYGGESGFENVFQLLDASCEKFLESITHGQG